MGAKMQDLVGKKFNSLTVVKLLGSVQYGKSKKRTWECLCDCGNTTKITTGALVRGAIKTCGCSFKISSVQNSLKSRHKLAKKESGSNSIYAQYRNNAKTRNYEFLLTKEEFRILISSNCFYCGIEPLNLYDVRYYNLLYNGIDRIDNTKGYTTENSVACCKMCNVSKNNNSLEYFLHWVKRIYKHNFEK
jgi:hypothetical protein